ncbi:DUF4142 domain-containing protein [bacterium]|nr:MAG: DUF4142 domain-containing protein [bacterium]
MKSSLLAASLLALVVTASAQTKVDISADGRPSRISAPKKGLNTQDKMSVMNAKVANLFEIKTSEIALKRGQNAWTKQFAKDMIKEHSAAHEELRLIAKQKGVMLDKRLPKPQMAILRKLETCPRAQFDAMYRQVQIMGHKETAMKFEKGIKGGNDGDVKGYLIKMLPAVKMHLKAAEMKMTMKM